MVKGKDFEVSKEVYERAKAQCKDEKSNCFYVTEDDINEIFPTSLLMGYGVYGVTVREVDGKYICSYERGDSCD